MIMYAVMMDYSVNKIQFGSREMYEARNLSHTEAEALEWIAANKPAQQKEYGDE